MHTKIFKRKLSLSVGKKVERKVINAENIKYNIYTFQEIIKRPFQISNYIFQIPSFINNGKSYDRIGVFCSTAVY